MNYFNRLIKGGYMDENTENIETMSKTELEAYCYRILVERDKLNEQLRVAQNILKGE